MAFFEAFPYFPATITAIREESPRVKTFTLKVLTPWEFLAGHHCVIRLTDEHGYMAARDYSISSAPSSGSIEISVARELDGEVSNWLHERVLVGDTVEISKVLGSHFTWTTKQQEPVLLLAGGIGVAPLMSILREHRLQKSGSPLTMMYSARDESDLCFRSELAAKRSHEQVLLYVSRAVKGSDDFKSGRISNEDLSLNLKDNQSIYICGPSAFVNSMEHLLHTKLGVDPTSIRTERFG